LARVIRAKYENGVLKPLESVDLEEGEIVKLVIIRGARGLINVVKRISREYSDVKEDPLKILLEKRR
jgi:predicted DNA-binding antitoxin AbrB/MazE fold protein